MKTKTTKNPVATLFKGRWRIVEMPDFEKVDIDEEIPAYIDLDEKGRGSFQFIHVYGEIDARFTTEGGQPCLDFAWAGSDEGDEVCGRGQARLAPEGVMHGTFFIFQGDQYDFTAEAAPRAKPAKKGRGGWRPR